MPDGTPLTTARTTAGSPLVSSRSPIPAGWSPARTSRDRLTSADPAIQLLPALGLPGKDERRRRRLLRRIALPLYLTSLAVATGGIVAWLLLHYSVALPDADAFPWWTLLAGALLVLPASEMAVAVINRLISESSRPSRLPRLALLAGIPDEHRTMVVIPAMLTKPARSLDRAMMRPSARGVAATHTSRSIAIETTHPSW